MFKNTIKGMDKIFDKDIKRGKVIIVEGTAGALKSSLTYSILAKYLASAGEYGLYITLEESKQDLKTNMRSIGIKGVPQLHISDFSEIREKMTDTSMDFLSLIKQTIGFYYDDVGDTFTTVTIDSFNALYSLLNIDKLNLRNEVFGFFRYLKSMNLTTFVIKELESDEMGINSLDFLADGIIELGVLDMAEYPTRYLQVKKMRGVKHSMKRYQVDFDDEGILVAGVAYSRGV